MSDAPMTPGVRRLGDGYEPHVDEIAGELIYSAPVDSGPVSTSMSFPITRGDLDVLTADPYRRAVLEVIGHAVLQRSMVRGRAPVSRADFAALVSSILHTSPAELDAVIDRADVEHHMVTRMYVDQVVQRRS